MRVPTDDNEIRAVVPNAPEPRASAPIEDAFGAKVHTARAGIGEAVAKIGTVLATHMQQRLYWDSQEKAYEAGQRYKSLQQDILFGQGETNVKDGDGKDVALPSGLMARKMQQATMAGGVTAEYDNRALAAKDKILGELKGNPLAYKTALRQIDSYMESGRNSVISHEATQDSLGKIATFDSAANRSITDMASAVDDKDRARLIAGPGGVVESVMAMGNAAGWPQDKIDETIDKKVAAAATVAVSFNLKSGGTEESATAILDSIPGLSPRDYADGLQKIKTMSTALATQRETAFKKEVTQNDKDMTLRYSAADPGLRPSQAELKIAYEAGLKNQPGGISEKLYNKLVQGRRINVTSEEAEDKREAMADALAEITDDSNKLEGNPAFEKVASYRAALIDAYNYHAISDAKKTKFLGLTDRVFDKGLDQEINAAYKTTGPVWSFLKESARYLTGASVAGVALGVDKAKDEGKPHASKAELKTAKAFLADALMERLQQGPIAADEVHTVAQGMLASYIAKTTPAVLGAKAVPNNVAGKDGVKPLHTMQVPSNSDRNIAVKKSVATPPITDESLEFTARQHNMTVEEVKKRLGITDEKK